MKIEVNNIKKPIENKTAGEKKIVKDTESTDKNATPSIQNCPFGMKDSNGNFIKLGDANCITCKSFVKKDNTSKKVLCNHKLSEKDYVRLLPEMFNEVSRLNSAIDFLKEQLKFTIKEVSKIESAIKK